MADIETRVALIDTTPELRGTRLDHTTSGWRVREALKAKVRESGIGHADFHMTILGYFLHHRWPFHHLLDLFANVDDGFVAGLSIEDRTSVLKRIGKLTADDIDCIAFWLRNYESDTPQAVTARGKVADLFRFASKVDVTRSSGFRMKLDHDIPEIVSNLQVQTGFEISAGQLREFDCVILKDGHEEDSPTATLTHHLAADKILKVAPFDTEENYMAQTARKPGDSVSLTSAELNAASWRITIGEKG